MKAVSSDFEHLGIILSKMAAKNKRKDEMIRLKQAVAAV